MRTGVTRTDGEENPKSEIRNPKEIRRPKSESYTTPLSVIVFGLRISDFELLSDFGLRISDFHPRFISS